MVTTARPLKHKVLARDSVDLSKRVIWAKALLFSRGLFQAAVWPTLRSAEVQVVHVAVMKVLRMVKPSQSSGDFSCCDSSADVLAALHLPAPINFLRIARVDLFVRLLVKPSPILLALLYVARNAKRSWVGALCDDLAYAAKCYPPLHRFAVFSVAEWSKWILRNPVRAKRTLHQAFYSTQANCIESWGFSKKLRDIDLVVSCDLCASDFGSRQALAVHKYRKHGWRHPARLFTSTTHCTVCLLEFWQRHRVLAHLMDKSPVCLANLQLRGSPMTCFQSDLLDEEARAANKLLKASGRRRAWADKPCVRLAGPLRPVVGSDNTCSHPIGVGNRWHHVC